MRKSKKGFIFTLFVITSLALIVMTYRMKVEFREEQRSEIYKNRVEQVNMFILDMEKDMERALYVTSFRAFLGIDEYIHRHIDYIDDVDLRLPELMLNGTLDGELVNSTNASTLTEWMKRMESLSKRFNINMSFEDIEIKVEHYSPWIIKVKIDTNVSITDFNRVIGWNYSLKKSTMIDISVANLPDPLYFVESMDNIGNGSNPLLNRIVKSPYQELWVNESPAVPPADVNVTNLIDHTLNQYYWNNTKAPSYLMRLEGNFSNSTYGIESFVDVISDSNIWEYSENGAATCVSDYQFFKTGCVGDRHNIRNMNNRFYLDDEHLVDYNMGKINST